MIKIMKNVSVFVNCHLSTLHECLITKTASFYLLVKASQTDPGSGSFLVTVAKYFQLLFALSFFLYTF